MEHIDMCCIVYQDDVLIYSNTLQQHPKDVSNILEAIQKSAMKVKPSKCEFHQTEKEYLGLIIGQEGVKTDPVKTPAIWALTAPASLAAWFGWTTRAGLPAGKCQGIADRCS